VSIQPVFALSPDWSAVFVLACGQEWPDADEDQLRAMAQAWTDALAGLINLAATSHTTAELVTFSVQAHSTEDFVAFWSEFTKGGDELVQQCAACAQALVSFAEQVEFAKIMINIQLVILAIQLAFDLFIAPFTGGLSLGESVAAIFATRAAVRVIVGRLLEGVLMMVLPDLITQGLMIRDHHRSSFDVGEAAQALQMAGLVGIVGAQASRYLGRPFGGLVAKHLSATAGGYAAAALTGAATNVGANYLGGRLDDVENQIHAQFDPAYAAQLRAHTQDQGVADQRAGQNPLYAAINGAFTGVLFHGAHEFGARPGVYFDTEVGAFSGVRTIGENHFTLFHENPGGPGDGRMYLGTLNDDGSLTLSHPGLETVRVEPTTLIESNPSVTTHSVFVDGHPVVDHVDRVSTGASEFVQDGQTWAPPKGSVITYTADDHPVRVASFEGNRQLVYAGPGNGTFTYVGHLEPVVGQPTHASGGAETRTSGRPAIQSPCRSSARRSSPDGPATLPLPPD
jgi:hypothetical protein